MWALIIWWGIEFLILIIILGAIFVAIYDFWYEVFNEFNINSKSALQKFTLYILILTLLIMGSLIVEPDRYYSIPLIIPLIIFLTSVFMNILKLQPIDIKTKPFLSFLGPILTFIGIVLSVFTPYIPEKFKLLFSITSLFIGLPLSLSIQFSKK